MDDYMDPYEEAEAVAVTEAMGLGGPADKDSSDDSDQDDSKAESDYEKLYNQLPSGNHQVRNPDGTFYCPFCPSKKKQDYKLKGLLQHADAIGVKEDCFSIGISDRDKEPTLPGFGNKECYRILHLTV
jgi:hypothetical protein